MKRDLSQLSFAEEAITLKQSVKIILICNVLENNFNM